MTTPDKPKYGSPCNSCGQCCQTSVCPLGQHVLGPVDAPCPALRPQGEGFNCGLVISPRLYDPVRTARYGARRMREAAAFLIGSGHGCDWAKTVEEHDPDIQRRMITAAMETPDEFHRRYLKVWGID